MIIITIRDGLHVEGLPPRLKAHMKKFLTIRNPMYFKLKAMGVRVWPGMEFYTYYKEVKGRDDILIVPRGMRERLFAFLIVKMGMTVEIHDETVKQPMKQKLVSSVVLRDYQEPIIQTMLVNSEGIICVGTGGGKTILACETIAQLGLTATVLVPNTVLLNQFVEEFKKNYAYTPGVIGDGKKEWDADVVVSTIQSLQADSELLRKVVQRTSVLMVDECQGMVSDKREGILGAFMPSTIFGLTATPMRSIEDGRTDAIGYYFGKQIVDHSVTQMNPLVHIIPTDIQIPMEAYNDMVLRMINDDQRNTLISGIVMGEIMSGRKVLVLTKRIDHYKNLQKKFPEDWVGTNIFFIDSEDKERNALLTRLKFGEQEYSAVFGTTSLLAVGLDIPSFDTLVIACDMKSEILTTQAAGRILRLFEGKPEPKLYDIFDNKNYVFTRQFKERERMYKAKGWTLMGRWW